ncbi:MAG TPA: hypothetical protein DCX54_05985 [Flavobacteriales bacterium]|nr:hypothetical protein [Flavobacteriales bacterium]
MKYPIYIVSLVLLFATCSKKEEEIVEMGPEPQIAFVSLDPMVVENFKNSVTLTITYKDMNGDLGSENPDVYSLSVKDGRLDEEDWYHVPPLAPPGYEIPIQGSLQIVLNSMFILGNGDTEYASLTVKIRDRAGHWSNVIHTPSIVIKKP